MTIYKAIPGFYLVRSDQTYSNFSPHAVPTSIKKSPSPLLRKGKKRGKTWWCLSDVETEFIKWLPKQTGISVKALAGILVVVDLPVVESL